MPGLVAFGRRWGVGGDDFVFPQITEAFFRSGWLAILLTMYIVSAEQGGKTDCPEKKNLDMYLLGLLLIYSITLVCCLTTAYVSSRGEREKKNLDMYLLVYSITLVCCLTTAYVYSRGEREKKNLDMYLLGLLPIYSITLVCCLTTAYVSSRGEREKKNLDMYLLVYSITLVCCLTTAYVSSRGEREKKNLDMYLLVYSITLGCCLTTAYVSSRGEREKKNLDMYLLVYSITLVCCLTTAYVSSRGEREKKNLDMYLLVYSITLVCCLTTAYVSSRGEREKKNLDMYLLVYSITLVCCLTTAYVSSRGEREKKNLDMYLLVYSITLVCCLTTAYVSSRGEREKKNLDMYLLVYSITLVCCLTTAYVSSRGEREKKNLDMYLLVYSITLVCCLTTGYVSSRGEREKKNLDMYLLVYSITLVCCLTTAYVSSRGEREKKNLDMYLLVYSITLVCCLTTAYVSSRGTMLNGGPRRRLPVLLYFRLLVALVELGWNIAGTVFVTGDTKGCPQGLLIAIQLTLAGSCLLLFGFLVWVHLVFDPLGGNSPKKDMKLTSQKARSLWRKRFKCLLCCARGQSNDRALDAFEQVAGLLANFFKDQDFVPTDTWAGILILVGEAHPLSIRANPRISANQPRPDWMNLDLAKRMMEFAQAVYGWIFYVYDKPCSPPHLFRLCRRLRCCSCTSTLVRHDNCCQCHAAAFCVMTGLHQRDLFHLSNKNDVLETPFAVVGDPETRSVVVTIRGTLSLKDAVTDLCATDTSLRVAKGSSAELLGLSESVRVHKGVMEAANYVYGCLTDGRILDDVFVLYPGYSLTITGHSLGAGVAAVVALLLRPAYPQVRCFAFSPPGGLVSSACLPLMQDLVMSIIVGDDLIPRLSYHSMRHLRNSIVEAIHHTDRPKYDILLYGCFRLLCGTRRPVHEVESGIGEDEDRETQSTSPESPLLDNANVRRSYTQLDGEEIESAMPRLYLPGHILHIRPDGQNSRHHKTTFKAEWSHYRRFEELKLSRWMVADHMPYNVIKRLKSLPEMDDLTQRSQS